MAQAQPMPEPDAIMVLEGDHRKVGELFDAFRAAAGTDERRTTVAQIIRELSVHTAIEEQIFYPAVRESAPSGDPLIERSLRDHREVKQELRRLEGMDVTDPGFEELLGRIMSAVDEHVREEEEGMFPRARACIDAERLLEMGQAMAAAKRIAPTRPHPGAPSTPPGNIVAGTVSAIADRIRDAAKRVTGQAG